MKKTYFILYIFLGFSGVVFAQSAREVGVEIIATLTSDSSMQLSWFQQGGSTRYQVFEKGADQKSWDRIADLSGSDTLFVDTNYRFGTRKEYRVARTSSNYTGFDGNGYIVAGFGVPADAFLGRVFMIIEDKYKTSVVEKIGAYIQQIEHEGYQVDTHYVSTSTKDTAIKNWIVNQYKKDTTTPAMIFLLGKVAVPYSGNYRPDGHLDHTGAWPADLFYGAFDILWPDVTVNNTSATFSRQHNVPGDGKYDISRYNNTGLTIQYVNVPVGRVDLSNMTAFGDDTTLMHRYLDKALLFRTGERKAELRSLVDDNFGYFGSEAYASGGFRNGSTFSGRNISTGDYRTEMSKGSYLLSYGCGAGSYTTCAGVTSTSDFVNDSLQNPFTMLFGSYFGDWDNSNNLLRAPLASKGWGLASVWSGRPYWMMHPCGLGAPLAQAALSTYNTWNIYNAAGFMGAVHVALMGDPTLRMFAVDNVHNIRTRVSCAQLTLAWNALADVADSLMVEINDAGVWKPVSTVDYSDSVLGIKLPHGTHQLSVRYLKLMNSASGTWWQYGAREVLHVEIDTFVAATPILASDTVTLCSDDIFNVLDQGNFDSTVHTSWAWKDTITRTQFGDTLAISLNQGSHYLFLKRESANGCVFEDSILVTVEMKPTAFLDFLPDTLCFGETTEFVDAVFNKDSLAKNYWTLHGGNWETQTGDTFSIEAFTAGRNVLALTHQSPLGCKYSYEKDFWVQYVDTPHIEVLKNQGRIGDTILVQSKHAADAYYWNGSKLAGTRTFQFVAAKELETLSLQVEDHRGCVSDITEVTLPFVVNGGNSLFFRNSVTVYPNPFDQKIHINVPDESGVVECNIYHINGSWIQRETWPPGQHTLSLEPLHSGAYLIHIKQGDGQSGTQIIIKNE
jgi:hypothetical protein